MAQNGIKLRHPYPNSKQIDMNRKSKTAFVRWMGPLLDALRELGDCATPQEASDLIAKNSSMAASSWPCLKRKKSG
jgi:truncated hemoglobin YjbI